MVYAHNELFRSSSPYLRQHKDNPVWWHEWREDVLKYARENGKMLFVSVGYATCHWCHVMAHEAFGDQETADYLNEHFVSIKVDREERPDIDRYLMGYISTMGDQGGWPLNCFLSPDLKPVYALTYAPDKPRDGMPGFLMILQQLVKHVEHRDWETVPFKLKMPEIINVPARDILRSLRVLFDDAHGGFGDGAKFPPHCTLLFALYYPEAMQDFGIRAHVQKTLDMMLDRGLHDHLQGGFFRYCIDREWRIPHFEKMLYDQAMMLWVLSAAYAVFKKSDYHRAAMKVMACLEDTFLEDGLYYAGHDADTAHVEGGVYLWDNRELESVLTTEELAQFSRSYDIPSECQFEGKNHLIRCSDQRINAIEQKLLNVRRLKEQPFIDRKIITSWNCLIGISLVQAHRFLEAPGALDRAEDILRLLLRRHCRDGRLLHSSCDGRLQSVEFMQDYAAMLMLITYIYEDTGRYVQEMQEFLGQVMEFYCSKVWYESLNKDIVPVIADTIDHPVPSSVAMAEFAVLRTKILLGMPYLPKPFQAPGYYDFMNLCAAAANGSFHIMSAAHPLDWSRVPVNTIQHYGEKPLDCYQGICHEVVV